MDLQFVLSEKGKKQLLRNGFLFYNNGVNERNGNTYWKCIYSDKHNKKHCSARIITTSNNEIQKETDHNHGGDAAMVEAVKVKNELRNAALTTSESPHVLIASASAGIHDSVAAQLPSSSSLKRTIRNVRSATLENHGNPKTRKEIELPPAYSVTEKKHNFVIYDKGAVDDRMIVFGTEENLRLLAGAKHWLMDGTFGACSMLFGQLYSIHAIIGEKVVPLIYALLPGRSSAVYTEMFEKLKAAESELNPETIMLDMEQAVVKALITVFPEVKIRFCNFHVNQALYRKVVAFNFKTLYDTNVEFAQKIKLLAALAFVKADEVVQIFNRISDEVFGEDEDLQDFLFSFETEFVARYDRKRIARDPQFPIKFWNQFDACRSNLPRTNNNVEGWHRSFNELVRQKHPSFWELIRCLKVEQSRTELTVAAIRSGVSQPPPVKKYRDLNERIRSIVLKYDDPMYTDKIEYVKSIANNLSI